MVAKRVIVCLDVCDGRVVKGVNFSDLVDAGDPASLAARYGEEGVDEIVVLDITATLEGRRALAGTVQSIARETFLPIAAGGGIRTLDDAAPILDAGADKVTLNTAAQTDPALITRLADRYGSQAVVVAIDVKRTAHGWTVFSRAGTTTEGLDAVQWARTAAEHGAGEILLTSIDRDGTRQGFDCDATAAVSAAVSIPVIASGGGGAPGDFVRVFREGRADAALAASIFHFATHSVMSLKAHLAANGVPVRLDGTGRC
jgi:cyclase